MPLKNKNLSGASVPPEGPSPMRRLLAGGTRVGAGLLAGLPAAVPSPLTTSIAAGTGALGELAAEAIEGSLSRSTPARMLVEGGISAVPFGRWIRAGKAVQSAIPSALLGGVGEAGREWARDEDYSLGNIGLAALLSGATGGVVGKLSSRTPKTPPQEFYDVTAGYGGEPLPAGPGKPTLRVPKSTEPPPRLGGNLPTVDKVRAPIPGPPEGYAGGPAAKSAAREAKELARQKAIDEKRLLEKQKLRNIQRDIKAAGLKEGKSTFGKSLSAKTPEGGTIRQSTPYVRPKEAGSTGPVDKITSVASRPAGITDEEWNTLLDTIPGLERNTPPNLIREDFDTGNMFHGGARIVEDVPNPPVPVDLPEDIGNPLARFFRIRKPFESPREPSFRKRQAEESLRILKQKMAEESTPRPPEWDAYPPEVVEELDRLGPLYRSAQGSERRGLGAQLSEIRDFMSGKKMRQSWRGAMQGGTPVESTAPPTPPAGPETPDWVREQLGLVDQLKKLVSGQGGGGGGESGAISPDLLMRLALAGVGGATGAATDPLNNRWASAALGVGTGFAAPSLVNLYTSGKLNTPEGIKDIAHRAWETLPNIQRFNYLVNLGIPANAITGPYGGALMGALEHHLAGDARGTEALKVLRDPRNFYKAFREGVPEAERLIEAGDIGRAETTLFEKGSPLGETLQWPARLMTTGDVAARKILTDAGFTDQEARAITLTSEPFTKFGKTVANFGRGERDWTSPLMDLMFPFKRTPANVFEQGAKRIPGLGFYVQHELAKQGMADSSKMQLIQQGLGLGVGTGAAGVGYLTGNNPNASTIRRYVSNTAGQYSLPAAIGFGVGQAFKTGQNPLAKGLTTAVTGLPVPATDTLEDFARYISGGFESKDIPRGAFPLLVRDVTGYPVTQTGGGALRLPRGWR